MNKTGRLISVLTITWLAASACDMPPGDTDPAAAVEMAQRPLDNQSTGGSTTCYVDGPLVDDEDRPAKGTMQGDMCCISHGDRKNCYECTADFECQKGGGDVGALVKPTAVLGTSVAPRTNATMATSTFTPALAP